MLYAAKPHVTFLNTGHISLGDRFRFQAYSILAGVMLDVMFPERFQYVAQDILSIQLEPVDIDGYNYQFKFATIFSRTYSLKDTIPS
jgi:hypothetical protein